MTSLHHPLPDEKKHFIDSKSPIFLRLFDIKIFIFFEIPKVFFKLLSSLCVEYFLRGITLHSGKDSESR